MKRNNFLPSRQRVLQRRRLEFRECLYRNPQERHASRHIGVESAPFLSLSSLAASVVSISFSYFAANLYTSVEYLRFLRCVVRSRRTKENYIHAKGTTTTCQILGTLKKNSSTQPNSEPQTNNFFETHRIVCYVCFSFSLGLNPVLSCQQGTCLRRHTKTSSHRR